MQCLVHGISDGHYCSPKYKRRKSLSAGRTLLLEVIPTVTLRWHGLKDDEISPQGPNHEGPFGWRHAVQ
ncbi:hypothetical protein M378DRAFT_807818 [Amanita muscaria Koide BX008]|uniref:Uncharacterized protein n=1 Tax=Amanita muscaria (strain Koide BX008) TaxID=946122 RepID=A0A0C2WYW8_AMAMK|nr:hypothetical protein M378DRAFT_807818 [Amanita muscaria Koide BX008]